jgi:hypothetical protein
MNKVKYDEYIDIPAHQDSMYGETCFCIGPEKCSNKECPLVKQYTERRLR